MNTEIILFLPPNEEFNRTITRDAFRWGWKLRVDHQPINTPLSSRPGVAIINPPFRNHIFHSIEGTGQILHKAFSAEEYPYISEVINVGLSKRNIPWIQEITRLLFDSLSYLNNPPLYTADTIHNHPLKKESVMCFDSILFLDRMKQGGHGGIFTGFLGTDWMKAQVYKQFDIQLSDNRSDKYTLLFAQRTKHRMWENPKQILRLLRTRFNDSLIIQNYYFSASPLQQQVNTFYQADILLAAHGSGSINAIFMLPHSVMIEVSPPHYTEFTLVGDKLHARLHYIYVSNFDYKALADNRLPSPDRAYESGNYWEIRKRYVNLNLTTNPFSIISAVDDAVAFLDHTRYNIVNDHLSPIFI